VPAQVHTSAFVADDYPIHHHEVLDVAVITVDIRKNILQVRRHISAETDVIDQVPLRRIIGLFSVAHFAARQLIFA
jgi:hypothetical protein